MLSSVAFIQNVIFSNSFAGIQQATEGIRLESAYRSNMASPTQFFAENISYHNGDAFNPPKILNIILPCVMSLLVLLTVLGNSVVLIVVVKTPKLQDIAGIYMVNLLTTDLIYGSVALPLTAVSSAYGRWVLGHTLCQLKGLTTALLCSVSYGTLALMSLEKYVAILKPLRYSQIMTKKAMAVSLCCLWMYMGILSVSPLFGWGKYDFIPASFACSTNWRYSVTYTVAFICAALLPSMVTINITYFYILRVARQQARRINVIEVRPMENTADGHSGITGHSVNHSGQGQGHRKQLRKTDSKTQTKAAMTVLIVVGVFMLSWSPLAISHAWSLATDTPLPFYVELVVTWLACLNSALNPYIYAVRTKSFQNVLRRMVRSCPHAVSGRHFCCLSSNKTAIENEDGSVIVATVS
ncbi:histamine H2 receptor-like [Ptychodera flava]|uniref:histamine H2 receptor-like n=1 Tax=Ptychodera flava TaxID=63121 RepID=UPI003969F724